MPQIDNGFAIEASNVTFGSPVEFRISEVTSIAVVNLPTAVEACYFRLVIQD